MSAEPTGGRIVSIEAKPEPIRIDLARTAALVVDMESIKQPGRGWSSAHTGTTPGAVAAAWATE